MKTQLYCGIGKVNITPTEELLYNLRGSARYNFVAVADQLYVRVIYLKNDENQMLFVGYDLSKALYPMEILPKLAELTGVPEDNIFYFGTHTHTAPSTGVARNDKPPRPVPEEIAKATAEYEIYAEERLYEAARQAMASVQPAKLSHAYGESYINVNRTQRYHVKQPDGTVIDAVALGANPAGPVDRTLFVMKVTDMQDKPIAFLINYPMHNCLMIWNNYKDNGLALSGDIAGTVSQMMERTYEGAIAVWCSGAAGDINPVWLNQTYYPCPACGEQREYYVQSYEPASLMLKVLSTRHFDDIQHALRSATQPEAAVEMKGGIIEWSETPGRDLVKQADGTTAVVTGEGVKPATVRLHGARIGDLAFIGINGELYSSLGQAVQQASPMKNTVLVTHDSTIAGGSYIFDDETLTANQVECVGAIPALSKTRYLPGYLKDSLCSHAVSIVNKLL